MYIHYVDIYYLNVLNPYFLHKQRNFAHLFVHISNCFAHKQHQKQTTRENKMNPLFTNEKVSVCQTCGECCKRYAISVLPHEVQKQARTLKLDEKTYTGLYTRLLVQLVPFSSSNHPLALPTTLLPKALAQKLKAEGVNESHVMILPMVGLKKREYCVFFDPQTFGCTIHESKPLQCSIFPFASLNQNEDYAKAHDFCELEKISSPTKYTFAQQAVQRDRMKEYFDTVSQKGMNGVWNVLPGEGDLVFNGKSLGPITLDELNNWLQWAREKNQA